jgi:hypothetical protein
MVIRAAVLTELIPVLCAPLRSPHTPGISGRGLQVKCLLADAGLFKPHVLTQCWVEKPDAQLLFEVHFVALGLDPDLRHALVLGDNVHPAAVTFLRHVVPFL